MSTIRHLLAQRHLAVLICAATLLLKLLVPTGYMIEGASGHFAIVPCSGAGPMTMAMAPMPGMHGDTTGHPPDHGTPKDHGGTAMPCAFAGLSMAALGATDPVLLVALIAFVMALGVVSTSLPPPSRPPYLRPPLRGPPADL